MLIKNGICYPQTKNWSPEIALKTSTATFPKSNPAGPPNCGHEVINPRCLFVRAYSIASSTDPPHSPPTPTPWIKRMIVRMTAPQIPITA